MSSLPVLCIYHIHLIAINIHTYIHTSIHTSIHPYLHTYILTYLHTYIHTYIHTTYYVRTYVRTCIHLSIHPYIHTYMSRFPSFLTYSSSFCFPKAPEPGSQWTLREIHFWLGEPRPARGPRVGSVESVEWSTGNTPNKKRCGKPKKPAESYGIIWKFQKEIRNLWEFLLIQRYPA